LDTLKERFNHSFWSKQNASEKERGLRREREREREMIKTYLRFSCVGIESLGFGAEEQ
jgi:hypothetical protein